MEPMTFQETKKVELDILVALSNFCDTHNLRYFLAYGTLIGAIRHKGFIPWDDDIDLQMPREDYNTLIRIFNTQKPFPYLELISPKNPISRHSFVKIIDTRTIKIEKGIDYKNGYLGVDVDIFPLDGQPDSDIEFDKWYANLQKTYHLYTLNMLKAEGSLKKRIAIPIIKLLFNKNRLKAKADKIHSKYPYNTSSYVGAVESSFNFKGNRVKKDHYNDFILVDFEEYKFKAPIGYATILTNMYGDYMKLPPKEKQITHHSNKSYWRDNHEKV